jgi:hypothetical protein
MCSPAILRVFCSQSAGLHANEAEQKAKQGADAKLRKYVDCDVNSCGEDGVRNSEAIGACCLLTLEKPSTPGPQDSAKLVPVRAPHPPQREKNKAERYLTCMTTMSTPRCHSVTLVSECNKYRIIY